MSNKPNFGRDAEEFLRRVGTVENISNKGGQGIRITALVSVSDKCVTVRVTVSGAGGCEDKEFIVLTEKVEELGLEIGEIDGTIMSDIEYFATVTKAYFSACSSFAYAPSSLRALEKKLVAKGFEHDVAKEAIEAVRARGFVDEFDIALRRCQLMIGKHWGYMKIIAKLREEGFKNDTVNELSDFLKEVDFVANCALQIERKYGCAPNDKTEKEKMLASLSRMGYSMTEIKKAIALISGK